MPREASRPLMTSFCPALMTFLDSTIDSVVCTRGDTGAALAGPASVTTAAAATNAPDTVRARDVRILFLQISASSSSRRRITRGRAAQIRRLLLNRGGDFLARRPRAPARSAAARKWTAQPSIGHRRANAPDNGPRAAAPGPRRGQRAG